MVSVYRRFNRTINLFLMEVWYERLREYKKAGLVRTGLRRRVLAEMYQMLKKREYHYGREELKHKAKMTSYLRLLERLKKNAILQKTA